MRINEVGYWSGMTAAAATLAYVIVQLLQMAGAIAFPLDEILLAFHHLSAPHHRFWTHAALMFTAIYAVFVTANYVVQLATVIPARLSGQGEALRMLLGLPWALTTVVFSATPCVCGVSVLPRRPCCWPSP